MADLSAVLRKTIDGLPRASPDLRAKVYEKARSAIERQIASASPPLSESVIEARRSALADAIDRTEDHYLDLEAAENKPAPPAPEPAKAAAPSMSAARPAMPRADRGLGMPSEQGASRPAVPAPSAMPPAQKPAWPKAAVDASGGLRRTDAGSDVASPKRPDDANDRRPANAVRPGATPAAKAGPPSVDGRAAAAAGAAVPAAARRESSVNVLKPQPAFDRTEPDSGLDGIPAADIAAPRYTNGRRAAAPARNRSAVLAGLAVLLLGGSVALAYVYRDELQALLVSPAGETTTVAATAPDASPAPTTTETPAPAAPVPAAPVPAAPDVAAPAASDEAVTDQADADAAAEGEAPGGVANTETAALAPDTAEPGTPEPGTPEPGLAAPGVAEPGTVAAPPPARRFTQRLLPDGTEVDEGPGTPDANAFDEGTNIAAASPPDTSATLAPAAPPPAAATEVPTEVPPAAPATDPAAATAPETQTAALPPQTVAGAPAVAQRAVFYEERTEAEQGSQQAGNVVWSVVSESPSEGQPPEPAIRAVADIPERDLKLTMTIRRNADATLPASHVIELMFDVPANFAGGQIANVQRLALKPTEEARGEPLIGVAGQISDGFFIIALNNLEQATKSNLELMGREEWIDIPIAYANGRRALISIDKGIPGDRAFKQALEAWAAKS